MLRLLRRVLAGLLFAAATSAALAQQTDTPPPAYHPQLGPGVVHVTDQSTFNIPANFAFFGADDARAILRKMGNFPDDNTKGLIAPRSDDAQWFMVVSYVNAGYISDNDAKNWNADDMLKSIREGTDRDNEKRKQAGVPAMDVTGWAEKPHYDATTHTVVWAITFNSDGQEGINYHTLTLGRHGYLSTIEVSSLADFATIKPQSEALLGDMSFDNGNRYADFSSATDKVAAVGLTALVVGAAAKAGILAKLGGFLIPLLLAAKKFVIYIIIVVGGFFAKLFRRRKQSDLTPR